MLAIPMLSLQTGTQALTQFPKGSDVRVGNELAAKQLGGGTDPVLIAAAFDGPGSGRARRSRGLREAPCSRRRRGSARSRRPAFAGGKRPDPGHPERGSESDAAVGLVEHLRDTVIPASAAGPGRDRRRRRRNRAQPRRPRPDQRLDVEDRPLRPRAQLPGPDGDAALAAAAAEGGADEPALDRRRVRGPGRDLPVGLARRPARLRKPGRARHDQRAADLRRRLRPLDGLRGLPDVADSRALRRATATTSGRSPRGFPPAPGRSPRRR